MKQHVPLYLKYRPQKLSELVGQEIVSKTLSNAILLNRIVHAYLFCGPRGTGKTSSARILAKSLNCENGPTADPCGTCISCTSISNSNSLDVIEIDAASHRKVEDAEDLTNKVSLGTYGSRYKIYIIDEVHMLTDHAFNALLKTLEEPPKNVIFILATTEEYKIIPTIISRCQKLDFKAVPKKSIEDRIKFIANIEKINIGDDVIDFISKRANGCLRDAVSLLDQISVLGNENERILLNEIIDLFGFTSIEILSDLADAILESNNKKAIDIAESLIKEGKDIEELYKALMELFIEKAKSNSNNKNLFNRILKIINNLQNNQSKLRFALNQELQFLAEIFSLLDTEVSSHITAPELKQNFISTNPKEEENNTVSFDSLDSLWIKIISLIDSNPTKALLNQSGCYLLAIDNEILSVGLSKDMFLPRLEKDDKKKEVILNSAKKASGLDPKTIKFKFAPREKPPALELKPVSVESDSISISEEREILPAIKIEAETDEFKKTIKDLLGAKPID